MTYRILSKLVTLVLAMLLALSAGAEGMIEWHTANPAESSSDVEAMPTLPPADALKTEAPLVTLAPMQSAEAAAAQTPPVTLAPAQSAEAAAAQTQRPALAPIGQSGLEDDGLLRVALQSLGQPGLIHLTLSGSYAVEANPGFRFDSGTSFTLTAAQDRVWLSVGGLTIDMGKTLTLTRHRAPEGVENGIRISESQKDALYCGDLTVTARGSGLSCILTLPVEDYLYGVVAYEMSDSFPLEALKAQAVAARTYAMRRKAGRRERAYDVSDTTADQVFKGYDPGQANVIRAVDDTRGVAGLYDGGFATCYYTASNGGQTALPSQIWGGTEDDGYLSMADDPYDLENPRSLQNELTVSSTCAGSAALKAMLEAALGEVMASAGVSEGEWAFDSIAAIRPVKPRFEGSRMYDGLQFDLRVKLLQPAATPQPAPTPDGVRTPGATEPENPVPSGTPAEPQMEWVLSGEVHSVTLDVFKQIKRGLSLGLNGADYELIDVQTDMDDDGKARSFTLTMRRYGHGVGMSQRGAQWMAANYGMTWRDILAFYYPGMTLARIDWPQVPLTALDELSGSTGAARPDPTYRPLPEPGAGERYAKVKATALNVRKEPSTDAAILEQLSRDRRVVAASDPDADGWVRVHTGEVDGYVKAEYLVME